VPSTSGTIADAVVDAIEGLTLDGDPPVRERKRPVLHEGDPDGVIFVSQGDGERLEPLADFGDGLAFLVAYPVAVAIVVRSRGKVGDNETLRAWREAIRGLLRLPDDIADVNDIEPADGPVFDLDGLGKGLDWSIQNYRVTRIEA
jgi:hypothetical protein